MLNFVKLIIDTTTCQVELEVGNLVTESKNARGGLRLDRETFGEFQGPNVALKSTNRVRFILQ